MPLLEVIPGFGPTTARGPLKLLAATVTPSLDNNDVLTARIAWPARTAVQMRSCVRLTEDDGTVTEWRINTLTVDETSQAWADLTGAPPLHDLATAGLIREIQNGRVVTDFAGELALSSWLTTKLLADLPAPLNVWLDTTLGPLDSDPVIALEWSQWTRLEFVRALQSDKYELALERQASGKYRIAFYHARGSTVPVTRVSRSRNLISRATTIDDQDVASVVIPLGDPPTEEWGPATIADNVWSVTAVLADNWITVEDLDGAPGPVILDDQYIGGALGWFNGSTMSRVAILDTRASDGGLQLASTTGLAVGSLVTVYATTLGTPLVEVTNPALVVSDVGRVEQAVSVAGGRGERNFNPNPELAANASGYSMGPHGVVVPRNKLGLTLSPLANGLRAAGTATTTPFAIDGLPANEPVYEGDRIDIDGRTMFVTTDAIPTNAGALTLLVNVGLPGALPDNAALTFTRRRKRTFTVVGTQNILGRGVVVTGADDGWAEQQTLGVDVNGRGSILKYAGLTATPLPFNPVIAARSGTSNRRLYQVAGFGGSSMPPWTPLAGGSINYVQTGTNNFTTIGGAIALVWSVSAAQASVVAAMAVNVSYTNLTGMAFILDSKVTNGDGSSTLTWRFDLSQLLPGESAPTLPYQISGYGSNANFAWSNAQYGDGTTLEVWEERETRTLYLSGAHAANATTLNFKPVTELARRDFTTSDTITLQRSVTVTMRVTGCTVTEVEEYGPEGEIYTYFRHVLTLDLASSNVDDLPTGDWHWQEFQFSSGSGGNTALVLAPLSGSTMTVSASVDMTQSDQLLATLPVTITATNTGISDTYAVTSAASWGSNGRVTVPVSIPAGRTYAAGVVVSTNFLNTPAYDGSFLKLVTAVTGAVSSVLLEGWDGIYYEGNVNANGTPLTNNVALYRIKGSAATDYQSHIPIQGDILYVAATTVANGSGQANVTLKAPNTILIADNTQLKITRRAGAYAGESTSGNAVRLLGTGWASGASDWTHFPEAFIEFYPGMTSRQLTASVWFVVNFDNGNQPLASPLQVAILNSAGLALGSATVAEVYGTGTPQLIKITTQVTITAAGRYRIGVQGGAYLNRELFIAVRSILAAGPATEVPYIVGSWANRLLQSGNVQLLARQKEKRSITASLAEFTALTGVVPTPAALTPGASYLFEDEGETLRLFSVTRDAVHGAVLSLNFESVQRTIARLLGAGTAVAASGTGSASVVSGGSSGGGTTVVNPAVGLTLVDETGAVLTDVRTLDVSGLTLAQTGAGRASLTVTPEPDVTSADAVITGGDWISRDLNLLSYTITIAKGSGSLGGRTIRWNQTTVVCPAANGLVYVTPAGQVLARAAGTPETLPTTDELLLYRTFVDVAIYGQRIYAIVDSRTWGRPTPRAPLFLLERVSDAKITSGVWAGATAVNSIGDINWYFANLGLYPFVETLPTQVKDHLDVQIAKFFGASGTANSAPTWASLHGTTWNNYYKWPYDVGTPRGTPVAKRADSHDAYVGTFLRLAVRYAKLASGGLTWWDANIVAIQDAIYYNILVPQRFVGGGYLNETFQDAAVYPFCQTMDNIEVYRGLKDALDLMTSRGGAQATWASTYSGTATNILSGVQSMWSDAANAAGETGWLAVAWDNAASAKLTNQLGRFYPDLTIGVSAAVYDVPLHGTASIARDRIAALFAWLNTKAPGWFYSRRYDLYPWGIVAAAAVKLGYRDIGDAWLSFVQRHHANDAVGYLLVQDLGWARFVERLLEGEDL